MLYIIFRRGWIKVRYNNTNKSQQYCRRIFSKEEHETWEQVGQEIGHLIEKQLIEVLDHKKDETLVLPGWFVSARLATPREDRRGIDVVVETNDLGCFFLQLKSSPAFVAKFLLGKTRTRIAVVVIRPNASTETIRNKFFQAAKLERQWLKKRRSGERPPDIRTIIL